MKKTNLSSFLEQCAVDHGGDLLYTMLRGEEEVDQTTCGELAAHARNMAGPLAELLPAGSRIILLFEQSIDFIRAFMACLAARLIAVPVPEPSKSSDAILKLTSIVANSEAAAILASPAILAMVQNLSLPNSESLRLLTLSDLESADNPKHERLIANIKPEDIAFLQYTSGSTRAPRGVMVSHANIMANLDYISKAFALVPGETSVTWLPMFHDMGLIGSILGALYGRIRTYIYSPLNFVRRPALWLKAISKYQAAIAGGPNFAYELCSKRIRPKERERLDLSNWRIAFVGAEPVRAATLAQFHETFGVHGFRRSAFYPCYGMAETTLFISGGNHQVEPAILPVNSESLNTPNIQPSDETTAMPIVSCGHAHAEFDLLLVDCSSGSPTRIDDELRVGEVWGQGPCVATGYWNNAEETTSVFHCHLETGEGPFLNTGDLAFRYRGEIYVVGRAKDLVIIAGKNHYPQDIEYTAELAHPNCRSGCCAAFSMPGPDGAETLVVVQEVKASPKQELLKEMADTIATRITGTHGVTPGHLVLIRKASIPRTSSGKIQRSRCRQLYAAGDLPVLLDFDPLATVVVREIRVFTAPRTELEEELAHIWSEVLGIENISVHDSLFELGGDSLRAMQIASAIGQQFIIPYDLMHLVANPTIAETAKTIEKIIIEQLSNMDDSEVEANLQQQVVQKQGKNL